LKILFRVSKQTEFKVKEVQKMKAPNSILCSADDNKVISTDTCDTNNDVERNTAAQSYNNKLKVDPKPEYV
jgi:hypothetical protein